jgi:hypothetical protein
MHGPILRGLRWQTPDVKILDTMLTPLDQTEVLVLISRMQQAFGVMANPEVWSRMVHGMTVARLGEVASGMGLAGSGEGSSDGASLASDRNDIIDPEANLDD